MAGIQVLITAGGTQEKIDAVRSISNTSTGRLASLIADCFAVSSRVERILYIAGKNAHIPTTQKAQVFRITGTRDLEQTIRSVALEHTIDAVIHCMAVSDYRIARVSTVERIAHSVESAQTDKSSNNAHIIQAIQNAPALDTTKKLSSTEPNAVLFLEQTPKIISLFSELTPHAALIGFKLLDNVSHDELIDTAYNLLKKNNCSFVLANDLQSIKGDSHTGYLVAQNKTVERYDTKQEIAGGIAKKILNLLKERNL